MPIDPLFTATAIEAALAAGRIQRSYFRQHLAIDKKGPIDLVTAADVAVERDFRQRIAARFPAHAVLGEEGATAEPPPASAFRWIVDPIDGTTNFAHGIALFCISIALEIDGEIRLGVVYDPIGDELFTAERGGGARLNGAPIRVSPSQALIDALLVTGFPYDTEHRARQVRIFGALLERTRGVRRLGSAALDLSYVAAGRFDAFWEEHLHAWDIAAGALLVAEAGGLVTDYRGQAMDVFRGEILASNGRVHELVRRVVLDPDAPS
ncbi:MAG TPA: inositol monophosphatase family protein [Vicinamibacterales bacterium]